MARLHQNVMMSLTADIVSGVRAPGEMLPREVDVAEQFDVSRGVARETIRAMEERGLIEVRHGRGATINEPSRWDVFDADVLAAALTTERASEVLGHYLECRRIVEVEAAGLAAERARKRDVKDMAAALSQMEAATTRPAGQISEELFHEADVAFHQALIAATRNPALSALVGRMHSPLLLARYPLARPQYRKDRALPEHRRILEAVERGSAADARKAMSDHLDTIAGYLAEHRRASRGARSRRGKRVV